MNDNNQQRVDSLITHLIIAMGWVLNLLIGGINTAEKYSTQRVQHSVGSKKNRKEYCNSNNNLLNGHKIRTGDPLLNKVGPDKEEPRPYGADEISWRIGVIGLFVNTFQFIFGFGKYAHTAQVQSIKVGRNEKCPCDSGKKHKHCCINKERAA